MARHRGILILASGLALFLLYSLFFSSGPTYINTPYPPIQKTDAQTAGSVSGSTRNVAPPIQKLAPIHVSEALLEGESIMPHLGNETLK